MRTRFTIRRLAAASTVVAATVLLSPAARAQSPAIVPVHATLEDSMGLAIDGTRDLEVVAYDAASGGTAIHTASFPDHPIIAGQLLVYLGHDGTLDLASFRDQSAIWLEVTVDSEVIQPRLRVATAPYAGHAAYCGDAATLDGKAPASFAPATHGHDWTELSNVPGAIADGDDDTFAALGACSPGSAVQWDGAQWSCGAVVSDAVAWPVGFAFFTLAACPAGFSPMEAGYVKLSSAPSLVPTASTLEAPGHFHSPGTAIAAIAGAHQHQHGDYHYVDSGLDPSHATGSGDDVGELQNHSPSTSPAGAHTHALSGAVGAVASGVDGDGVLPITGDLEHVAVRLCVKD